MKNTSPSTLSLYLLPLITTGMLLTACDKDNPEARGNSNTSTATSSSANTDTNTPPVVGTNVTATAAAAEARPENPLTPPLVGTQWRWITDPRFSMQFEDEVTVVGRLNCKDFRGQYLNDPLDGTLSFPQARPSTAAPCADSAPDAEARFSQALGFTQRYTVADDILTLDAGDLSITLIRQ